MADDPSPPQDFSPQKARLREVAPDNRSLFIDAMADPLRRRVAFNVVERNCRERFAEREEGIRLYLHLRGYVQSAAVWMKPLRNLGVGSSRCSIKSFGKWPDYEPPTCHGLAMDELVLGGIDASR